MGHLFYVLLIAFYFCFTSGRASPDNGAIRYPGEMVQTVRSGGNRESPCTTPSNGNGTCKSLFECEPLLALVNKKDRTPEDIKLLQKSQCGFVGSTPTVCCPNPCNTPDGYPGQCISIYQCAHIANSLRQPTKEILQFVQNSKCQGPDQYSVCCGPPPATTPVTTGNCQATVSAFPPDPKTLCCGLDSRVGNKIVGGIDATVDQYPWLAIIEYIKLGPIKLLCGGVLISGKYVLTAGHCVAGAVLEVGTPTNVRLGEYDTSNDGEDCVTVDAGGIDCTEGAVIIPIERTIPHPGYNPVSSTRRNDIGLIRLKEMAPFTDFIRPICLPLVDLTAAPPKNFTLYAAGWGAVSTTQASSRIKQHVRLPFISFSQCQPAYSVQGRKVTLWDKQVCAGGEAGKDSCKGDSGGPLMFENGKTFEVIGIVSFGPTPCGMEDIPGVYTKVYAYNDWIKNTIQA